MKQMQYSDKLALKDFPAVVGCCLHAWHFADKISSMHFIPVIDDDWYTNPLAESADLRYFTRNF